jgi:hypothetical protein
MADLKISALPASTTPLAGTEVLPIVQSSTTKQVSVANLTAGRAISATQITLTTGNVIVANGQGIDFSATSGTGTSELLADYEEGTWTPGYTSWLVDPTVATTAKYTKIGRLVNVSVYFTGGTTQAGSQITGLPFTCGTEASMISTNGSNSALVFYGVVLGGGTAIGSLSAQTLTSTYYAVTTTYMV